MFIVLYDPTTTEDIALYPIVREFYRTMRVRLIARWN